MNESNFEVKITCSLKPIVERSWYKTDYFWTLIWKQLQKTNFLWKFVFRNQDLWLNDVLLKHHSAAKCLSKALSKVYAVSLLTLLYPFQNWLFYWSIRQCVYAASLYHMTRRSLGSTSYILYSLKQFKMHKTD